MNSQLNNEKAGKSREKTTKTATTFRRNKPNSPNVQINVTNLITMNYAIFTSLTKVKNKPNQTQFKANSNPIGKRPKMNINNFLTKDYKNISRLPGNKTNPIQSQFKPNFEHSNLFRISLILHSQFLILNSSLLPLFLLPFKYRGAAVNGVKIKNAYYNEDKY